MSLPSHHRSYDFINLIILDPAVYPHLEVYPSIAGLQGIPSAGPKREAPKQIRSLQRPKNSHLDLHLQVHGKSEPSPIEKQRSEQRARFTHEDLHNQVFPKSQSPSKRELPTPPSSGSPVSAPTHLPVLRRPRSGTLSTRPPLPTPPGEAPAAPVTIPARPGPGNGGQ